MSPAAPKRAKAPAKKAAKPAAAPVREAPEAPAPARMPPATWAPAAQATPAPTPTAAAAPAPTSRQRGGYAPGPDMSSGAADFWRSVYEVARKDMLQHIRTKRLLIIGIFFVVVLQLVTMVFPLGFGLVDERTENADPSHENMWFFFHLNASLFGGLFAVQLLAVVLTSDAVSSEWSGRTIFLMLSKPVSRTAFVVGKYVGAVASIMPMVLVIYTLQYLLMNALYAGAPDAGDVAGFIRMLGLLTLGAMSVAAVALLFSTLTKSNVTALILSLLSVLILFPLVNAIGDIYQEVDEERSRGDVDGDSWKYKWSHYAHPAVLLNAAPGELVPEEMDEGIFGGVLPQVAPDNTGLAVAIGLAYTALLLALSILRVNLRNFE